MVEETGARARRAASSTEAVCGVYSVVDTESASVVQDRAVATLGERYVDLWITEDGRSYVVGVLDLTPPEIEGLVRANESDAPVELVPVTVSRASVDDLLDRVSEAMADQSFSAIWPDYDAGQVVVVASQASVDDVRRALADASVTGVSDGSAPPRVVVEVGGELRLESASG